MKKRKKKSARERERRETLRKSTSKNRDTEPYGGVTLGCLRRRELVQRKRYTAQEGRRERKKKGVVGA